MSVVMFFTPISGIFSIASSLTKTEKEGVSFGTLLSEEDYKLFKQAVGSYEESMPGQVFNIITSKDGRSFDLVLCDKLITVKIDDRSFNIRHDIENIGNFATDMLSTGILDVVASDSFTSNDLINIVDGNRETIEKAFESLGKVELIDLILRR